MHQTAASVKQQSANQLVGSFVAPKKQSPKKQSFKSQKAAQPTTSTITLLTPEANHMIAQL